MNSCRGGASRPSARNLFGVKTKKCRIYLQDSKKGPIFAIQSQRWGISSVGRAFEWHSKGQEFDSPMLHEIKDLR